MSIAVFYWLGYSEQNPEIGLWLAIIAFAVFPIVGLILLALFSLVNPDKKRQLVKSFQLQTQGWKYSLMIGLIFLIILFLLANFNQIFTTALGFIIISVSFLWTSKIIPIVLIIIGAYFVMSLFADMVAERINRK